MTVRQFKNLLSASFLTISVLISQFSLAQVGTAKLRQKINQDLSTNNAKGISAAKLRSVLGASADAIDSVYTTFSLADGIGEFDASTGIAKVTSTGATSTPGTTPAFANGKYFDVVKAGTSSVTGSSVAMAVGGKIIVRGTSWGYIPPADLALTKAIQVETNVDVLSSQTTGSVKRSLSIPLTYTRNSSSGSPLALGNLGQVKNADRSVTVTGWTDFTTNSHITDMAAAVSTSGLSKIILTFRPTAFVTTGGPCFGAGFVSGSDRVIFLWRSDGQLAYTKTGTSTFTEMLTANAARDYFVNDTCRIELSLASGATTVTLFINSTQVAQTTSSFLASGDIIIGMRGSMSSVYTLTTEQPGQIQTSLTTAKTYTDTKAQVVQAQIDSVKQAGANLMPNNFVSGSYYKQSDGVIGALSGWKRTASLIPVTPNTTYTLSGLNTEFIGNEYSANDATVSANRVRVIAAGVGSSATPFRTFTFTTSPSTTYVGINVVSNPKPDSSAKAMLQKGSVATAFEEFGKRYLKGSEVRGTIPGYLKTADATTNYPKIFYSLEATGYNDGQSGSTPATGQFYVYVKYEAASSYYARYRVAHLVNATIRADVWKITGADLYQYVNGTMVSQSVNLLTTTENEFVFKEGPTNSSKTDFTGGYHGDETLTDIAFFADGVQIASLSSDIPLTAASDFWYIQKSNMIETDNASINIRCVHHKNTRFLDGGFTTKNRVIWAGTVPVYICYFGLATVTHAQATTAYSENYNYVTNVAPASPGVERVNETGARELNYFNPTTGLGAFVTSRITKVLAGTTDNTTAYDQSTLLVDWDVTQYAKYYRRLSNKTTSAGEVWEGEMTYKPLKK